MEKDEDEERIGAVLVPWWRKGQTGQIEQRVRIQQCSYREGC